VPVASERGCRRAAVRSAARRPTAGAPRGRRRRRRSCTTHRAAWHRPAPRSARSRSCAGCRVRARGSRANWRRRRSKHCCPPRRRRNCGCAHPRARHARKPAPVRWHGCRPGPRDASHRIRRNRQARAPPSAPRRPGPPPDRLRCGARSRRPVRPWTPGCRRAGRRCSRCPCAGRSTRSRRSRGRGWPRPSPLHPCARPR